ncbi:hypothetical protein ACFC1R_10595 [Kitasatospora sp. NPDC056138]|uniref:hypothetical protein n=1 Tax=Kitasatospora sp. NPDC056138 TaxID=3345724 RepID=UPI0035DFC70E
MKTAKLVTVPLALGLALTATTVCATTTASAASDHSRSRTTRAVTLTNGDNGRAVAVTAGDVITVRLTHLRDQGDTWVWSAPTASASAVLRRIRGGTSPDGDATATFRADTDGTSDITASRRCVPDPGSVCPRVVIPWRVTVTVT